MAMRVILIDMKDRNLFKLLLQDGQNLVLVKGSHHKMKKGEKLRLFRYAVRTLKRAFVCECS